MLEKMPVLFLAHGSPMNAISTNDFTQRLQNLRLRLPIPKAILCVSAHWLTQGTWVTSMKQPKTIHDFFGFPKELFDIQYPAPGGPVLARSICNQIDDPIIQEDKDNWGLDHGSWSILRHIFPEAHIPVIQLSLDIKKPLEFHYFLGTKLKKLRNQGIIIIGSGNIVHNLRTINWEEKAKPFDWAVEFDEWVKFKIINRDFSSLYREATKSDAGQLSLPTPDHYVPLLYVLGAAGIEEDINFVYEGFQNASISMRSLVIGETWPTC